MSNNVIHIIHIKINANIPVAATAVIVKTYGD